MKKTRRRKPDSTALRRLVGTGVTSQASYRKVQNYLTEYDRVVSDYEKRWGVERLPLLVDPELRDRYWSQMDRLNAAIKSDNPTEVEHQVQVTLRAYAALEARAKELGAKEIDGFAMTAPLSDGRVLAICREIHEVGVVKKDMPDALVYSVQEIAGILTGWFERADLVHKVKDVFPDATVSKVMPLDDSLDDEIPF